MKILLACVLLFTTGSVLAQERSATGDLDNQLTWSDLSGQISSADAKAEGAKVRMAQIVLCGNKGMLYAPGAAGADNSGCKPTSTSVALSTCYQRAGTFGTPQVCNSNEVVTKVCSSGGDSDCIAPVGAIFSGGQTAQDGWQGPRTPTTLTKQQGAYTVITCCKIQ